MAKPLCIRSLADINEAHVSQIATACNVPASAITDVYSCTPLQLSMISETRNETLHMVLRFSPTVSIEQFCDALRKVVALNAPLRTRLVDTQSPMGIVQVVVSDEYIDATEVRTEGLETYLKHDQITPPHTRSVFGVPLFRSARFDRVLVVTMNHAIMDYWSITQLLSVDVPAVMLEQPPVYRQPFQSFVVHCLNVDEATAVAFWKPRFTGMPALFPAPGSNNILARDFRDCSDSVLKPCVVAAPAEKISLDWKTHSILPSHVPYFLEAAWALTAAELTGTRSVAYGYVLSGRSSNPDGSENSLGPTISEVPIQVNLPQNLTVDAMIKERATSLRQLQQQSTSGLLHYGLKNIGALSAAAEKAAGFQMLFNIRPQLPNLAQSGKDDVVLDKIVWFGGSIPLQLVFTILDDGVMIWPRFDRAVMGAKELGHILDQFGHTLCLIAEASPQTKIDDLPLLDFKGRANMDSWNQQALLASPVVEKSIHALFRERVRMQPQALAIDAHDGTATYSVLEQRSDRLAAELREGGVCQEQPVAVIFEKSLWSVVAMLAILKAGGACVPVDNRESIERTLTIIANAGAKLVLTSMSESAKSRELKNARDLDVWVIDETTRGERAGEGQAIRIVDITKGHHLAYILNNVQLEHRNLTTTMLAHVPAQRNTTRRTLQWSSIASPGSIFEIWGSLVAGACVCIPEDNLSVPRLSGFIRSVQVNFALLPPHILRAMSPTDVPSLQSIVCIGAGMDTKTCKIWSKAVSLFNGWGTCESAMLSTIAALPPHTQDAQNIGHPVASAVWIVKPLKPDELVPFGAVGELVVTGPGVARGYLPHDQRAASFISPPPAWATSMGSKMGAVPPRFFRTGDLARYNLGDNTLSFIGRRQNLVKLGSYQIQLEEVETAIASCDEVSDVAAAVKIVKGRTQLIAIVCLSDPRLQTQEMENEMQQWPTTHKDLVDRHTAAIRVSTQKILPVEKVPTTWIAVQKLPRTTSDKIDRAAIRDWLRVSNF